MNEKIRPFRGWTASRRRKQIVSEAILVLLLATSSGSATADPIPGLPTGLPELKPEAVIEGNLVPFDGILMPHERALILGQKAERCDQVRLIEMQSERVICGLKMDGANAVRALVLEGHKKQIAKLEEALERLAAIEQQTRGERDEALASRQRWAQLGGGFGVAIGMASTVAVGVASVWIASQLANVVVARQTP